MSEAPNGIRMKRDVTDPVVKWLKALLPDVPVIIMHPNAPAPEVNSEWDCYITLQVTTPLQKLGSSDWIGHKGDPESLNTFVIAGQRSLVLSLNSYLVRGERNKNRHDQFFNAQDLLIQVQDATEDPLQLAVLQASGLAVWSAGDILDLTELVETGYESRAQLDLTLGLASNRESDIGYIERVELEAKVDGQDEPAEIIGQSMEASDG